MKSLYCAKGTNQPLPVMVGIKPPLSHEHWLNYARMKRCIELKADLGWGEYELRQILRQGNVWSDFPIKGCKLVGTEFKLGDEAQRVDILYIRNDGGLLPCELKIGGTALDTHGQLIRYIADLHFQDINLDCIRCYRKKFTNTVLDATAKDIPGDTFDEFIKKNHIKDRSVRILPKTGIIMYECFKPQLLEAVRYLNEYCGFSIRLIQIKAFVADDWNKDMEDYLFRIDFSDVQ